VVINGSDELDEYIFYPPKLISKVGVAQLQQHTASQLRSPPPNTPTLVLPHTLVTEIKTKKKFGLHGDTIVTLSLLY
jgi:hypothetical protein